MFYLYYCKSIESSKIPSVDSIKRKIPDISSYKFDQGCLIFDEKCFHNVEKNSDGVALVNLFNAEYALDKVSSLSNIDLLRETRISVSNSGVKITSDLFGSRPIYQYIDEDLIIFSSSMELIEGSVDKKLTIDLLTSILECISIKVSDNTLFKEIVRVPPSTEVTISDAVLEEIDLFDEAFITPDIASNASCWESLARDRLKDVLAKSCNNEKHPFVSLTAGYDSRLTLSMLPSAVEVSAKTWGNKTDTDVLIAKKLAKIKKIAFANKSNFELVALLDDLLVSEVLTDNLYSHGDLRHHFIMAALLKVWHGNPEKSLELNSLGGEIVRSIYYEKCKTKDDNEFYKAENIYKIIDQLRSLGFFNEVFSSQLKEKVTNIKVLPGTLTDPRVREDYFNLRFRFGRAWSVRYNSTQRYGKTLYPLMDPLFLYYCYKIPSDLRQGSLLFERLISAEDKLLLGISFNPHKKITAVSKIKRRLKLEGGSLRLSKEQLLCRTMGQAIEKFKNRSTKTTLGSANSAYLESLFGANTLSALSTRQTQETLLPSILFRFSTLLFKLEKSLEHHANDFEEVSS
jgi:hypothetical protein